jgi:hypothetical protein
MATLELENKLQTKNRDNATTDLAILRFSSDYYFKPEGGNGSSFSDLLCDIELMPYSWLRIESDATYSYNNDYFKTVNVDAYANFGNGRSFGIGHRYERGGGKEITSQLNWRLNPIWMFKVYERYQFADARGKGLKEQEYGILRDMHCWQAEFAYNISEEHGHTIWLVLRLKAFPGMEFGLDQSYHKPKDSE